MKIAKHRTQHLNTKLAFVTTVLLILLLSLLSYWDATNSGELFRLEMLIPINLIEGFTFLLCFGFGFPLWLAILSILLLILLAWILLKWFIGLLLRFIE